MCPRPEVHVHATPEEAAETVAQLVCALSAESIAARGRFTVALAGGSTPAALYRLLTSPPLAGVIGWAHWHVFWGDERCVPPDHPDSNYGMAHRTLLAQAPIPPPQVHRMRGEDAPEQAAADYAQTLQDALSPDGRLDLALLGIGEDGHTASLFPGTEALTERERLVAANWAPHLDAYRITLTFPALNRARNVAVLVTGADKADAVRRALAPSPGDATPPIALVDPMDGPALWHVTRPTLASLPDDWERRR